MDLTPQLTIGCSDLQGMVAFWAETLGYVPEPAPGRYATWRAYWAAMGVPETESPVGAEGVPESIIDPTGRGPRAWFQQVPEPKVVKNRWRFDLKVGGAVTFSWTSVRSGQGHSETTGQSECHRSAYQGRAEHRALLRRHAGPRGQQVRHRLTAPVASRWTESLLYLG